MINVRFSKIWILIIIVILLGSGIFTWQYFRVSKEETKSPEEKIPKEVISEEVTEKQKTNSWKNDKDDFKIGVLDRVSVSQKGELTLAVSSIELNDLPSFVSYGDTKKSAEYGKSLISGDFNGDGYDDLIVGSSGWSVRDHTNGKVYAQQIHALLN
jgi:hypothetical protein